MAPPAPTASHSSAALATSPSASPRRRARRRVRRPRAPRRAALPGATTPPFSSRIRSRRSRAASAAAGARPHLAPRGFGQGSSPAEEPEVPCISTPMYRRNPSSSARKWSLKFSHNAYTPTRSRALGAHSRPSGPRGRSPASPEQPPRSATEPSSRARRRASARFLCSYHGGVSPLPSRNIFIRNLARAMSRMASHGHGRARATLLLRARVDDDRGGAGVLRRARARARARAATDDPAPRRILTVSRDLLHAVRCGCRRTRRLELVVGFISNLLEPRFHDHLVRIGHRSSRSRKSAPWSAAQPPARSRPPRSVRRDLHAEERLALVPAQTRSPPIEGLRTQPHQGVRANTSRSPSPRTRTPPRTDGGRGGCRPS